MLRFVEERDVAGAVVALVDHAEEVLERRAEPNADPAVRADLERPVALGARRDRLAVRGVERIVEMGGHGAPFRGRRPRVEFPGPSRSSRVGPRQVRDASPDVNRPAWLFSARARVSSHSEISRVHLGVLVGLALDRRLEVVPGGSHGDTGHRVADLGEEVEVPERVSGLSFGDGAEERGDVGVALDVGLLGEVQVAAVGLALAGERLLEVVVGLGPLQCGHGAGAPCWL